MIKKILYLAALILGLLLAYHLYDYYTYVQQRNQSVKQQGQETTLALRDQVDQILASISVEGKRLAELLGSNDYTAAEIEALIKESSLSIKEIQGVTACFEPDAFSDDRRLYCPYYDKGSSSFLFMEDTYDYSIAGPKGTAWYTSVRDEGAKWVEPYYGAGAKDWFVDFGIPFHYSQGPNKGKVRGTITMSFVCGGFKELVHSLSLGKTGYGMITSNKGTFLAHPVNDYVGNTNLAEIAEETEVQALKAAFNNLLNGEAGNIEYQDEEVKDETLFFYDKIPTSGWGIGLMFFKDDLLGSKKDLYRRYIKLSMLISLLFVCILAIYYNKDYLDEGEIWTLSGISTALLILNIALIGNLQHIAKTHSEDNQSPPMTDLASVNTFVNQQHAKSDEHKTPRATPIPTGLFIQRLEFEDSYNLNVGGTIWQKYPLDIADKVNIGFTFPQMSPFAEASYIEESYRDIIDSKEGEPGYLLVGSDFRVTLRLNLKYSDFPFDKRHLNIEIVPLNNNDRLLFTPDLASYNYTNPSQKSGINKNISISGNQIRESYFNYSLETYDSDFGYGTKALFEDVPVLHFNINLRRILLNAFITYLIPIFVTLLMVFILIYACGKTEERQGIIESMAAFFFVLIFSHIDLRKEIITADLIYMEYPYFIAYFMLILATSNLITYSKNKSKIFDFNDNQLFKASFFPIFFLILLMVTLFKFY